MLTDLIWVSILFGLASAFFGALSNVLAKLVMNFSNARDYSAVNFAIIFLLLIPFTPFFFNLEFSIVAVLLVLAASFVDGLANYFYFKAFEINDSVTASIFLSLSPVFTLLLLPFIDFAQNQFTLIDVLGVLTIVFGIIALNWEIQRGLQPGSKNESIKTLLVPILASFLFGANIYLIKYIFNLEIANSFTYYFVRAFIISVMMFGFLRPNLAWITPKHISIAAGRSSLVIIQWMFLLYALNLGNPVIVKAVSDTSPLFVIVFAFIFLKEKLTRLKILGVIIVIVGLILLTV
ncbi:MAG: DMT family transporter [Anaerolineales bacterium]|nr:DMT family transporter [Chloroflexota bacterium]MBL6981707.1 DMT family transporter [Anaerolineales bacterium]